MLSRLLLKKSLWRACRASFTLESGGRGLSAQGADPSECHDAGPTEDIQVIADDVLPSHRPAREGRYVYVS